MKSDFMKFLECQSCKSGFEVKEVYTKDGNELVNAIISCQCSEYPVLGGIPIIKKPSENDQLGSSKYIIQRLKTGNVQETMSLAFEGERSDKSMLWLFLFLKELGPFKRSLNPMISTIRTIKKKHYKKYSDKGISFFDLIDALGWGTWGDYLKHRFSCSSFWTLYPFMPMIEEKNEMVLDLLCGAGHGSFVISHYAHPESHVCVDLDYTLLFIAKKYFAPDAQFICLDANDPLPLKDRIFSSVIMMDSTHYVSNRNYLGKECQRVKENKGVLLWLHLHNALSKNPSEGYPLSPSRWADLMGDLSTIILPEEGIINQYMKERRLDLLADYPKTEIDSSSALCIMGAEDRHMMRTYENIDCPSLKTSNNMIINPMYDMRVQNGEIKLKRADLNEVYKSEYPLTFKYLPASYSLSRNFSHYLDGRRLRIPVEINRNDEKILEDLLKRFIILQVPEKYV